MPFWRSFAHLVWTTKDREPWIPAAFEPQLYAQMVDAVAQLGCYVYAINGMADHVHVVLAIPPKHSVAHVVKILKGSSAHFVNHVLQPDGYHFQWQRGYGYLSLGQRQLARAMAYVERQKEHHAQQTINRWLERVVEQDDGPDDNGSSVASPDVLREDIIPYDVGTEWPF